MLSKSALKFLWYSSFASCASLEDIYSFIHWLTWYWTVSPCAVRTRDARTTSSPSRSSPAALRCTPSCWALAIRHHCTANVSHTENSNIYVHVSTLRAKTNSLSEQEYEGRPSVLLSKDMGGGLHEGAAYTSEYGKSHRHHKKNENYANFCQ